MSQEAPPEVIDVGDLPEQRINTAASDPRDVPWKEQNQVSQGQANLNFTDSSGPLFNMYIKMAEEEDNKVADRWQKDADGILIFTGLFSAAIAALVAVSVQDLKPNSQDTSAFYLGKIFQLLADPNVSRE
ncbi:hypothetical protein BGW80DRAFT_618337 [Lactifluus volemus]|nr:hypothetical protein BGW80DRAFT_618337 [Lactifluus volemus]